MGTVLQFRPVRTTPARASALAQGDCEIVIFPGIRIERHDLDLAHRLRDSTGQGDFDGLDGNHRPRATS